MLGLRVQPQRTLTTRVATEPEGLTRERPLVHMSEPTAFRTQALLRSRAAASPLTRIAARKREITSLGPRMQECNREAILPPAQAAGRRPTVASLLRAQPVDHRQETTSPLIRRPADKPEAVSRPLPCKPGTISRHVLAAGCRHETTSLRRGWVAAGAGHARAVAAEGGRICSWREPLRIAVRGFALQLLSLGNFNSRTPLHGRPVEQSSTTAIASSVALDT
jgi:hypothetical protein